MQAEAPLFYGFNNSTKGSLNKPFFVVTFCDMGDYTTAVERADDGRRMMCATTVIHIVRRPPNNHAVAEKFAAQACKMHGTKL